MYIAGMLEHPGFFLFYANRFACKHILMNRIQDVTRRNLDGFKTVVLQLHYSIFSYYFAN
ncbi:hypothetical protein R51_10930 [Bacillus safensis]|nr:hypothetical protein R51_10930 [Bacillus safensis]